MRRPAAALSNRLVALSTAAMLGDRYVFTSDPGPSRSCIQVEPMLR
jgi:hypothetical protein